MTGKKCLQEAVAVQIELCSLVLFPHSLASMTQLIVLVSDFEESIQESHSNVRVSGSIEIHSLLRLCCYDAGLACTSNYLNKSANACWCLPVCQGLFISNGLVREAQLLACFGAPGSPSHHLPLGLDLCDQEVSDPMHILPCDFCSLVVSTLSSSGGDKKRGPLSQSLHGIMGKLSLQ